MRCWGYAEVGRATRTGNRLRSCASRMYSLLSPSEVERDPDALNLSNYGLVCLFFHAANSWTTLDRPFSKQTTWFFASFTPNSLPQIASIHCFSIALSLKNIMADVIAPQTNFLYIFFEIHLSRWNTKKSLPNKIGPLVSAANIHELVFESDGKITKKNLPNKAFYQSVKIKIGRTIVRRRIVIFVCLLPSRVA